jgi:hypothetical protein
MFLKTLDHTNVYGVTSLLYPSFKNRRRFHRIKWQETFPANFNHELRPCYHTTDSLPLSLHLLFPTARKEFPAKDARKPQLRFIHRTNTATRSFEFQFQRTKWKPAYIFASGISQLRGDSCNQEHSICK